MIPKRIQYLIDNQGEKTAVIIPINEWTKIMAQFSEFAAFKERKNSLSNAFSDVFEMKSGTKEKISLEDFLEEL